MGGWSSSSASSVLLASGVAEVAGAPKVEVPKPENPVGLVSELPKLPNVNPPVEGLSSLFVVLPKENPEVVLVSEFSVDAVIAPKLNPLGAGESVLSVVVVFPKENPGVGFDSVLPDDPKVKAEKCQQ